MDDIEIPLGCSWSPTSQTTDQSRCMSAGTVTIHGKRKRRHVCPEHAYDAMTQVAERDGLAILTTPAATQQISA